MDKNWLIRTKSNHILGPVSKEKVQELYRNGSIKPDDEICSGNGFWFFLREDEMVSRYLLGEESQGFNPVSEAKDVLYVPDHVISAEKEEFPTEDDITKVGGISLSILEDQKPLDEQPPVIKESSDNDQPPPIEMHEENESKKKRKIKGRLKSSDEATVAVSRPVKASSKKQILLKWIGILGFIVLFCLIYYRKTIIHSIFRGEITFNFELIQKVHAQEAVQKKNSSTQA
jgi:hypothetical protein